jgi:hypothetical protein
MVRNLTLEIGHDYDVDVPDSGYDGWKLISFGRRHNNFENPEKFVKAFDRRTRDVTPASIGLQRKLNVGLAFWLSYYEHGDGAWSLIGEGTQDQWNTAYLAGLLTWTGKPGDIGAKTLEDRAKDARDFLENYNDWANGNTFWFRLVKEDGEDIESIGGLIGDEALSEVVGEELKAGDNVLVEGDGAWLKSYLALPDGVNLVDEFPERDEAPEPDYII